MGYPKQGPTSPLYCTPDIDEQSVAMLSQCKYNYPQNFVVSRLVASNTSANKSCPAAEHVTNNKAMATARVIFDADPATRDLTFHGLQSLANYRTYSTYIGRTYSTACRA